MEHGLFALALVSYFGAAFVWPTWRSWRYHGIWPIVFHREAAPAQRLVGVLLGALFAALLLAALMIGVSGPAAFGVAPASLPGRVVGWLLLALGALVTIVAQRQMDDAWRVGIDARATRLVTHGVFRFCRNPIFAGLLAVLAGMTFIYPGWWSVVALLAAAGAIRLQVALEERHLMAMHGAAYRDYARETGRFVPLLGRLRSSNAGADLPRLEA